MSDSSMELSPTTSAVSDPDMDSLGLLGAEPTVHSRRSSPSFQQQQGPFSGAPPPPPPPLSAMKPNHSFEMNAFAPAFAFFVGLGVGAFDEPRTKTAMRAPMRRQPVHFVIGLSIRSSINLCICLRIYPFIIPASDQQPLTLTRLTSTPSPPPSLPFFPFPLDRHIDDRHRHVDQGLSSSMPHMHAAPQGAELCVVGRKPRRNN